MRQAYNYAWRARRSGWTVRGPCRPHYGSPGDLISRLEAGAAAEAPRTLVTVRRVALEDAGATFLDETADEGAGRYGSASELADAVPKSGTRR